MKSPVQRNWGKVVSTLLLAAFLTPALIGSAQAYDGEWQRHEMRARHWHVIHPVPVPRVVYAPPVIVAPPPPPSPGLNLIIPMHFN